MAPTTGSRLTLLTRSRLLTNFTSLLTYRLTLLATGLWIAWATVLWGLCYLVLRRRARRALRAESYPYPS